MNSRNVGIESIKYYVPSTTISCDDVFIDMEKKGLIEFPEGMSKTKEKYIQELKNKIENKDIPVELSKTPYEMLSVVTERFFKKNENAQVDLVIFTGELSPLHDKYSTPHKLIYEFGLSKAMIFELGNRCASISTAVELARSLLEKERSWSRALVISQNHKDSIEERFHQGNSIEGDGASLISISETENNILLDYRNKNFPQFNRYLFDNSLSNSFSTFMEYINSGIEFLRESLEELSILPCEIDQVILQNINSYIPKVLSRKLGLEEHSIFTDNIKKYGHIADIDFPINLKDYLDNNTCNNFVISQNTGAGMTTDITFIKNPGKLRF